jgi:hypothetical protein
MITQENIPKGAELFTSAFYSERDDNKTSFYTFGWIDQDLVKASGQEIAWADIDNSQGFWQFPSTSATINGKKIQLEGNTAIADTGTTLALVSDEVCDALYKEIKGAKYDSSQQGWLIPTTSVSSLPDFSVAIGDTEFVIQKEDLLFAMADDDHWYGGVSPVARTLSTFWAIPSSSPSMLYGTRATSASVVFRKSRRRRTQPLRRERLVVISRAAAFCE